MSIVNGLFAGRSGISSHGAAIAVVGDNISNSSTIGYKASRAEFEDLIAGAGGAGRTIGSGSNLAAVTSPFTQGTLEFTNRSLDLAIDGNGVFAVADGEQRFYTRAGNFQIDSAGNIVDQNGYSLLGYPANGTGALESINVNSVATSSVTTTEVSLTSNLNSVVGTGASTDIEVDELDDGGTLSTAPDTATASFAQLGAAASHQSVVEIVDSLGAAHQVTFFYFKDEDASGSWRVKAYVDAGEVGGTSGDPYAIGESDLTFNASGALTAGGSFNLALDAADDWTNGAADPAVTVNLSNFTQQASPSNDSAITQNGQGVGAVTTLSIDTDGTIFANLSNGETATIGQIGLVNFANPEGLQRVGNNLLVQSNSSGEPIAGTPGSGTFGDVQSGSLELSTTDIATEFVKLITLQRGFQASSRIITTINQLLNEVIQLA